MALAKLPSASLDGISAAPVQVEVDVAQGLPGLIIVGLADKAVEESRERVRSAVKHAGYKFPLSRITVHLSPSEKKKSGVHFDLPIAVAILVADGQLAETESMARTLCLGGLSLDGSLQVITGALSLVDFARESGFERVILPLGNYHEARLIGGIELVPVTSLTEVLAALNGETVNSAPPLNKRRPIKMADDDWLQIRGQAQAKRAAVIAAAGGHNLLLEGPPGAGKTLLARGLRTLLPPLEKDELIEVVKLHSVAGQIAPGESLDELARPFRSPHHTASQIAIVGGGSTPRPGEISLAHRGVLFLDELPEFQRPVLEALRQPLEDGQINVARIERAVNYPADFILIATMNPCPCGWLGSNQKDCVCTPFQINNYRKRVSGPIVDRIDLYLKMPPVALGELKPAEPTAEARAELATLRAQIVRARRRQQVRQGKLNASLAAREMSRACQTDPAAETLLAQAGQKFVISGRGYHRLLKTARTIADLNDKETIGAPEMAEAIRYRFFEAS